MNNKGTDNRTKNTGELLSPNNIHEVVNNLRVTRDLKSIIDNTNSNLNISLGSDGKVRDISLIDRDGVIVGMSAQLQALGGMRRFLMDAVKQAETESSDARKVQFLYNIEDSGETLVKLKQDANGRLSELLRLSESVIENLSFVDEWEIDDWEGVTKSYIMKLGQGVMATLKAEAVKIATTGKKVDKDFTKDRLLVEYIPVWIYNKLTSRGSVSSGTMSGLDFLYPKNYMNGIKLNFIELDSPGFVQANWIVTRGNQSLIYSIEKLIERARSSINNIGCDAERVVNGRLDSFGWLMVPLMEPDEHIERYKEAKVKMAEFSYPEGLSGIVLKRELPVLEQFNYSWSKFMRFHLYDEKDKDMFWKYMLPAGVVSWQISQQRGVRYWASELVISDFYSKPELKERMHEAVLYYAVLNMGIYDRKVADLFIESVGHYCNEPIKDFIIRVVKKTKSKSADDAAHHKAMKAWTVMPSNDDVEVATKEAALIKIPRKGFVFTGLDQRLRSNKGTLVYIAATDMHDGKDKIEKDFISIDKNADNVFKDSSSPSGNKVIIIKRLCKQQVSRGEAIRKNNISVCRGLTEKTEIILRKISRNADYGIGLVPKIRTWLMDNYSSKTMMQEILVDSIFNSLISQDFFTLDEEDDE